MTALLPPDSRIPEEGSRVGSWLVQERVGGGTHGVVFRAVHADRPEGPSYALKLARQPEDARFEREATLLSRIHHPAVPHFEDQGVWTSPRGHRYPYVVMQWVEGVPLYKWAETRGVTLRQTIWQLAQVARALEATHEHGVHRDVKGDNVRVDGDGRVVLLDFGCCWYQGAKPLTDGAMPPGTEQYRSPALLLYRFALSAGAGRYYEAEAEDDVYALGVTAYRLLASTYPALENAGEEDIGKPIQVIAPRGVAERCPELSALILRMLSEDPMARGSANQVARELERLLRQVNPLLDAMWIDPSSMVPTDETVRSEPAPESEPAREPEPDPEPTPESAQAREPEPEPRPGSAPESSRSPLREFQPYAGCITAFIALVLLLRGVLTHDWGRGAGGYTRASQAAESPDAGTKGIGEEAVAAVSPAQTPPSSGRGVSRQMPDEPGPGQKHPPCTEPGELEIKGGCWWAVVGAEPPPCRKNKYEYKGVCYVPVINSTERVPTSDDPP
jgi:serine/threonine protein kinase